jgi:hypothetical protein
MLLMEQRLAEHSVEMLVGQLKSQAWQQEVGEQMRSTLFDFVGRIQAEAEGVKWPKQRQKNAGNPSN